MTFSFIRALFFSSRNCYIWFTLICITFSPPNLKHL